MASATKTTERITLICPNLTCRGTVIVPVSMRGQSVRCAHCNMPFRIPLERSAPNSPDKR